MYTSPKDINMAPQNNESSRGLNLHMFQQCSASLGFRASGLFESFGCQLCVPSLTAKGTGKMDGFLKYDPALFVFVGKGLFSGAVDCC